MCHARVLLLIVTRGLCLFVVFHRQWCFCQIRIQTPAESSEKAESFLTTVHVRLRRLLDRQHRVTNRQRICFLIGFVATWDEVLKIFQTQIEDINIRGGLLCENFPGLLPCVGSKLEEYSMMWVITCATCSEYERQVFATCWHSLQMGGAVNNN